ncbi:MAG: tetratricopeptide repeat protein [Armatimonadota bacterium]
MPEKFPMRFDEEKNRKPEKDVVEESRPEPKTADGNKKIADTYISNGRVHEAITRYKKAARMEDSSEHRTDLGDAYSFAELSVKAIEQYRRAIKKNPADPEPYFGLAEVYVRFGKWHSAITEFNMAVELKPDSAFYRYKLSTAYIHAEMIQDAAAQMEQAVLISPGDAFYWFELASMYADLRLDVKAVGAMVQAVKLSPNDDYYTSRLGMLYMRIDEPEKAAEAFRNTIRINPRKQAYRFLLGDIYQCQGFELRAESQYNEAQHLDRYDEDFISRARKYMQGEKW